MTSVGRIFCPMFLALVFCVALCSRVTAEEPVFTDATIVGIWEDLDVRAGKISNTFRFFADGRFEFESTLQTLTPGSVYRVSGKYRLEKNIIRFKDIKQDLNTFDFPEEWYIYSDRDNAAGDLLILRGGFVRKGPGFMSGMFLRSTAR
jgi:hypothetical protein